MITGKSTISKNDFLSSKNSIWYLTIGDGVYTIGTKAFYCWPYLRQVKIGDSVKNIEGYAFCNCYVLEAVTFSNGLNLTYIGEYAFQHCYSLLSISLPDSVISIGEYAFRYCNSLKTLHLSLGLKTIDSYAFENCTDLTEVVIPNSVTSLGSNVFDCCENLSTFVIGDNITELPSGLTDLASLSDLTIGRGIKSISKSAFRDCTSLES